MTWIYTLLKPFLTPILGVVAVLLVALSISQCTRAVKAEHKLAKVEKIAVAVKADLATCRGNTSALKAALDGQNRALEAKSAEDAQRLAEAGKGLSEALRGRERAEAKAAKLLRDGPVGVDVCARAVDAFETVKAGVR